MELEISSPWFAVWFHPRETIRRIVETNPGKYVLIISVLSEFCLTVDSARAKNAGDGMSLSMIFVESVLIGIVFGPFLLYVGGWILTWAGRKIGGQAESIEVRAAIAWSAVPILLSFIIFVLEFFFVGKELFTSKTPLVNSNTFLNSVTVLGGSVEAIISVWAFIIFLKCLGEVHRFSAWKSLLAILFALLSVFIPLLIIIAGLAFILK